MTAPLCFIDTETDGVHPGRKPWEIALIRRKWLEGAGPNTYEETTVSFFVEIDLSTADPFGLKVGGFYERHPFGIEVSTGSFTESLDPVWPEGGERVLSAGHAARIVARFTHGAHLVGAVPNFDAHVFDGLLRDHGLAPAWHYHLVDIEAMAVGYLHGRRSARAAVSDVGIVGQRITIPALMPAPPWKSDDLSRAVGVEPPSEDERHTALGDARWAKRLYDAITSGAQ